MYHRPGRKGTLLQFTKNSKTDAGNYRPVSLTYVLGKVMESFIRDHLLDHMTKNTLFCEAQHGFVTGRSCMTQLLITLELWTEILDSGVSLNCIFILTSRRHLTLFPTKDYSQNWTLMQ